MSDLKYKTIYFVRHAESLGNVEGFSQLSDTPLTDAGLSQLPLLYNRCKLLGIQKIISSPYLRAYETASYIGRKLGLSVELSDLLIERIKPSVLRGVARKDENFAELRAWLKQNQFDPNFRYSDEENITDLIARSLSVLQYLCNQSEDVILVATHGMFMRFILTVAIYGPDCQAEDCINIVNTFSMNNTGLCEFRFYKDSTSGRSWKIKTWNDYGHLL